MYLFMQIYSNILLFARCLKRNNENNLKIFENAMVFGKNSCIFVYSHSPSPLSASEYNLEEVTRNYSITGAVKTYKSLWLYVLCGC
jgi:hypothetical protein